MQLLEHFKELSIYPKNAKELKGLILQLAIQGKLTADWRLRHPELISGSDSAEALLASIKAEKEQLIKDKKIKKEKPLPAITKDEIPFDLPEGWEWSRLGNISLLINGDRGKNYPSKAHYIPEGIPFITAGNLGERYLKHDKLNYISEERYLLLKNGQVKTDDILYCLRGSLGKCSIVEGIDTGAIASSLCIVRAFSVIDQTFLLNYFLSPLGKQMILRHDNGTAQPNLSATDVKTFLYPLPPLEEQKAIVETVNTLFKEVEALEKLTVERISLKEDFITSALRELSTGDTPKEWVSLQKHFSAFMNEESNIKKLRETILQLAVQGKLTANWRTSHSELISGSDSAKVLLANIKAEKEELIKDKKIKKEKPLPAITADEIPYGLPEGWEWCRLVDLVEVGTGSTPAKSNSSYYTNGNIPWYTSSATSDLFAKEPETLITELALKETNCKVFPSGSLIIAMYGQGKTRGQISELVTAGATNQAISAMVFFKSSILLKDYLKLYFQKIYHEIRTLAEGGAQPNLNVGKIKNTIVPLPSKDELLAIIEKVNSLMALCDELEKQVVASKANAEMLMQSVLREVFQGKSEPKPYPVTEEEILIAAES